MNDERIAKMLEKEDTINAFIERSPDAVREGLDESGILSGKVLGIKSCICVKGRLSSCASKTLENYVAPYDATVASRIKKEGALILGMTNMDEFACGSTGDQSYYGPCDNPRAPGHITGGSSSGSAAAVAAGYVDMALGSDTGGSVRNPASYCGVVGFKPSYGVVSRYGLCDMAMSLDQIGPFANNVSDAALLLDVISGKDPRDATSLDAKSDFLNSLNADLSGKTLAYVTEFDYHIADEGIKDLMAKSISVLKDSGAKITEVKLPSLSIGIPTYYLNMYVEFFSATRKYDGRRFGYKIEDSAGEEVLRRILLGSYISQKEWQGKFYRKALMARSRIRKEILAALDGVDALVGPVVPCLPHKISEKVTDPRIIYAYDIFTVLANLAGIPAGSVPAGEVKGFPMGLHVMGKPLDDQKVLDVMAGFEKSISEN